MEQKHADQLLELKVAFQEQEAENNSTFILTIETLEKSLQHLKDTFNEKLKEEIKCYMDVSLLNQYQKQIDVLKTPISNIVTNPYV